MESTIIHGLTPGEIERLIERAVDKRLKLPKETKFIPKLITAKRLNKTVQTLDAWHQAGKLRKVYIGGRVFYKEDDIKLLEVNS